MIRPWTNSIRRPGSPLRDAARTSASSSMRPARSGDWSPSRPNRSTAASRRRGMPGKSSVPSRNRATATSSAAIERRAGTGPDAAGLARDPKGREACLVGRPELEVARGYEVGRRRRGGAARGIGECVLDREAHIGGAQLGLQGAIDELDGRVNDALGVDDHLDRLVADIVQPVRLDDLQALVREGRRVDRDLLRPSATSGGGGPSRASPTRGPPDRRGTARPRRSARAGRSPPSPRRRGTARWPSAPNRSGEARPAGSRARRAAAPWRWPPRTIARAA